MTATIPVDTTRVLHLVVPEDAPAPCPVEVFVNGERFGGTLRDLPAESIVGIDYRYPEDLAPALGVRCPSLHVRLRPVRRH